MEINLCVEIILYLSKIKNKNKYTPLKNDSYNFLDTITTICFYWIEITDVPNGKNKK